MATTTLFSFGLKMFTHQPHKSLTLSPILPFTKKQNPYLNLTSSNSISSARPLVLSQNFTIATPLKPLTVVCAKGYKMKTHKASAKRFRVTGTGKIVRRRAGKQHLLRKKNTKRKNRLSKMLQVDRCDYNNVIGALPYLKVDRSN